MRQVVLAILGFLVILALSSIPKSFAHDHSRPELDGWFKSLQSAKGPCCDGSEALRLDDVDWDSKDDHYRVRLEGEWVDVPDTAVVQVPNRASVAMVWPYRKDGKLDQVRCFLPGAAG